MKADYKEKRHKYLKQTLTTIGRDELDSWLESELQSLKRDILRGVFDESTLAHRFDYTEDPEEYFRYEFAKACRRLIHDLLDKNMYFSKVLNKDE